MADLANRLQMNVAWTRTKIDLNDRCFINHPFEIDLVQTGLDDWLNLLRDRIAENSYISSSCEIVDIPKAGWHLRPGALLALEDNLLYQALILECVQAIRNKIDWSGNERRFSSILHDNQEGKHWFRFGLTSWSRFRETSLERIDAGAKYVVFADISAFFENIDLQLLAEDLSEVSVDQETRQMLGKCLNHWAMPSPRGIPQGHTPSFVLAELYLVQ